MSKIYNIKYTDAFYIKDKNIGQTKLHVYETYGYLEKYGKDIVICFIKKYTGKRKKTKDNKENIIKGLIIPDVALLSFKNNLKLKSKFSKIKIGSNLEITWRDVVYVANLPRYDCSIMYTEGILLKIEKDHIILKDPETICIHPMPIENHPQKKPYYYIIPKSFIVDFEIIK